MTIDEAVAIVRDEAAFCRSLAEKEGKNIGGDFAAFMIRKAEAQEVVCAEVERLRVPHYYWLEGESYTYETLDEALDDHEAGTIIEVLSSHEFPVRYFLQLEPDGESVEYDTREAAELALAESDIGVLKCVVYRSKRHTCEPVVRRARATHN